MEYLEYFLTEFWHILYNAVVALIDLETSPMHFLLMPKGQKKSQTSYKPAWNDKVTIGTTAVTPVANLRRIIP